MSWFFMWTLCLAEDSLETSSLIFPEKQWKKLRVNVTEALSVFNFLSGAYLICGKNDISSKHMLTDAVRDMKSKMTGFDQQLI